MRSIRNIAMLLGIFLTVYITPQRASAQGVSVSYQVFYDDLTPYGTWVDNPDYGYVWVPNAGPGFEPYNSGGHWVYTEYGWTWASDYAWGWAPFHYGRWYTDPSYGPIWVPGEEWGPAWVTWRRSEGYYGWAPMEPGISMSVYAGGNYRIREDRWTFVHDRDFDRSDVHSHYVNRSGNAGMINSSSPITNTVVNHNNNTTYMAGPQHQEVQKVTGRPVNTVAIHDAPKPGQKMDGSSMQIYHPQVRSIGEGNKKPMPAKVAAMKDVKPAAERNSATSPVRATPTDNNKPAAAPAKGAPARSNAPAPSKTPAANPRNETKPANDRSAPIQPRNDAKLNNAPIQKNEPRQQPATKPQPQSRPEPVRQQMPPQSRPAPVRQQDPAQSRPAPERQQAPQQRPDPARQQAPPQQRPEPIRQQAPQQQPSRPSMPNQAPPQQRPEQPRQQTPQTSPEPPRQEVPQQRQETPKQEPRNGPHN